MPHKPAPVTSNLSPGLTNNHPDLGMDDLETVVVPFMRTCYEYSSLCHVLSSLIEDGSVSLTHPLFQNYEKSNCFFVVSEDDAKNWLTKLQKSAANARPGCDNSKHIYNLMKIFLEDLMFGFREPKNSPVRFSELIRLGLELILIQGLLFLAHENFEVGQAAVVQLLNHKIWQPVFRKFFSSKYAIIELRGYQSVNLFPIPGTPLWTQEGWDALWKVFRDDENKRRFRNDYRALVEYHEHIYDAGLFDVLDNHFSNERAFFRELQGFKKSALKKAPNSAETEWFIRRLKKKCLVKTNKPHSGDRDTADLVGLVAFAHALLEVERIIQETVAKFYRRSRENGVPESMDQKSSVDIPMAISGVFWRPVRRHVLGLIRAEEGNVSGNTSTTARIGSKRKSSKNPAFSPKDHIPSQHDREGQSSSADDEFRRMIEREPCGKCRKLINVMSWLQHIPEPDEVETMCICEIFLPENN